MNRGNPPFEEIRYYFFDLPDCVLSFFEVPKGSAPRADRNRPAGLQQIAFSCRSDQFYELHKRLQAANVPVEKPFEVVPGTFAYTFWDPFGTRLEALCAPDHGSRQRMNAINAQGQTREAILGELATLSDHPGMDNIHRTICRGANALSGWCGKHIQVKDSHSAQALSGWSVLAPDPRHQGNQRS